MPLRCVAAILRQRGQYHFTVESTDRWTGGDPIGFCCFLSTRPLAVSVFTSRAGKGGLKTGALLHKWNTVKISVIIPTLNEASVLEETLRSVRVLDGEVQVIVSDGDSCDDTVAIASRSGADVVTGVQGRGGQMMIGAREATGDVLWFLHADTLAPPDATEQIRAALQSENVVGGHFRILFEGESVGARVLSLMQKLFYSPRASFGDSAIFVRREAFDEIGGYRAWPLFEDVDLISRLRRIGRFVRITSSPVRSSARRIEKQGFFRTWLLWVLLMILYWLRVPPERLGRMYAAVR